MLERLFQSREVSAAPFSLKGSEAEMASLLEPELRDRRQQREDQRLNRCRELLAEREQIEAARDEASTKLSQAVTEAEREEKEAQTALAAAKRKRATASAESLSVAGGFRFKLANVSRELGTLASPEIAEFIGEMIDADQQTRLALRFDEGRSEPHFISGRREQIISSNREAIIERIAAIRVAVSEAKAMKFSATPRDEIVRRLEELKNGLPDGHRFEETRTTLPDVRDLQKQS
jgi:hypothetical protein